MIIVWDAWNGEMVYLVWMGSIWDGYALFPLAFWESHWLGWNLMLFYLISWSSMEFVSILFECKITLSFQISLNFTRWLRWWSDWNPAFPSMFIGCMTVWWKKQSLMQSSELVPLLDLYDLNHVFHLHCMVEDRTFSPSSLYCHMLLWFVCYECRHISTFKSSRECLSRDREVS